MIELKNDDCVFYILIVHGEPRVFKGVITSNSSWCDSMVTVDYMYNPYKSNVFYDKDEAIVKAKKIAEASKQKELEKWDKIMNNVDFTSIE